MSGSKDDFYVGYLKQAPPALAAAVRGRILLLLVLALGAGALITATQQTYSRSTYEYGRLRTLDGIVLESPAPQLLVPRPGAVGAAPFSRYMMVKEGKFGAGEAVKGLHGKRVTVEGALIYRDGRTMIELSGKPIEPTGAGISHPPAGRSLGRQTLTGEIVDSKCYHGVMNPGHLKTHKACAIRCISGGIPPCFLVRRPDGTATTLLLVDEDGGAVNDRVLDRVAEPLEIQGTVRQYDDLLVLYADPDTFRRL